MASEKIKGLSLKIGGDTNGLAQSLDEINSKSRTIQTNLKTVQNLLKLDPGNADLIAQKQDLLSKSIENTETKYKALNNAYDAVQDAFKNNKISQDEYIAFQNELVRTKNKLDDLKDQAAKTDEGQEQLGDEVENTTEDIKDLGDQSLKSGDILKESLASELIISGVKAIGGAIKDISSDIVDVGMDFESSMAQVAATMGMTSDEIHSNSEEYAALEAAATQCGKTTKYTAAESAEALNYLALAGYDVEKSVATLPKVLTLSQASGMDLATTSDLVTDSMAALNLETDRLDNYMDQLAKTSQKSNTSVQQLGEGLLECGGTVTTTGQSLEKTNTALGVLANNGIKGSEGGTKLRNVLLSLSAPTDKARAAMDNLGLSVSDSSGNMRDIDDIMGDLQSRLKNMSSSEQTEVLNEIFNKQDLSAVTALLKSTNGEFDELYNQIIDCDGAAADMANTMNDNLRGKMDATTSALESVGIAIYGKFAEPLKNVFGEISERIGGVADEIEDGELSESFEDLAEGFEDMAGKALDFGEKALPIVLDGANWLLDHANTIIGLLAGIATAMLTQKAVTTVTGVVDGIKNLATALQSATTMQEGFNVVASASPWGLLATGAGILVSTLILLNDESSEFEDNLAGLTDAQKELVEQSEKINDETEAMIKDWEEGQKSIETQYGAYEKLVDKLFEMNEAEELSIEDKALMKSMVDELNDAMPELNLLLDEETGHLKNQKEEVMDLIEEQKKLNKVKAAQDKLVDIAKQQLDIELQIADMEKEVEEAYDHFRLVRMTIGNAGGSVDDAKDAYNKLNEQLETLYDTQTKLGETEQQVTDFIYDNADAVETLSESADEASSSIDDVTESIIFNTESVLDNAEAMDIVTIQYKDRTIQVTKDTADRIDEINQKYEDTYKQRAQELQNQLGLFQEFSGGTEYTVQDLLKNLESQQKGIENWSENIKELAKRGVSDGLLQELQDAGPSSANAVQAMTQMTDEQLQWYCETWESNFKKVDDIVEWELQTMRRCSDNEIELIVKAPENQAIPFKQSLETLAQTGISGYKEALLNKAGFEKTTNDALAAIQQVISNQKSKSEIVEAAKAIGTNIMLGVKSGIESQKKALQDNVLSAATGLVSVTRKALGINSPSKVFEEIGDYLMQGEIAGINRRSADLYRSVESVNAEMQRHAANISLADTILSSNAVAKSLINAPSGSAAYTDPQSRLETASQPVSNTFTINLNGAVINDSRDLEKIADELLEVIQDKIERKGVVFA